ncbi:MAG: PIN domain-containing protein [Chthoniobacterales bacterium]|nr:PIN domain-containing protein [Chthoniobacterales bacterium]
MESGSVLVDSNVYIGLLRRGLDPVEVLGDWAGPADLATCGMVRLEVERGLRVERVRRHMSAFFDVLIMIPTGNPAWARATELAWSLDRRGITLPAQDCLIAACAQAAGAAVLTDDRHFDYIARLEVLRPSDELDRW